MADWQSAIQFSAAQEPLNEGRGILRNADCGMRKVVKG